MTQMISRSIFIVFLTAGLSISTLWGCGPKKEVPFVIDEEELVRYLIEVPEAKELFRKTGLIQTDPYSVPFDNGTYSDSLIKVTRWYAAYLNSDKTGENYYADYGNLGLVREAYVTVMDSLHVQTTRAYADTTIVDTSYRILTRDAFFLKLGDDSKDYVGWSLWGFNGIGEALLPVSVRAQRFDLSTFPGDLALYLEMPKTVDIDGLRRPFVRLSDIEPVVPASRLRVTTEKLSSRPATYQLLSDYSADGAFTTRLSQAGSADVDTLSYKTESSSSRYYRVAFMQAFTEDQGDFVDVWCVPYRQ
jgi:hypothetical protein